ncbi:MAG: AAA family ATPase [Planctomycetota bacterium]
MALHTHRLVLMVGEPGSGKTQFLQRQCVATTGLAPEELQGGPKVDDLSFFGRYTLVGDTTHFVDGPLSRALKSGTWFVLNDAGHVPFAQLSALLVLRHGTQVVNPISQEVLPVPPTFRLAMTTNRENAACRNNTTAMQSLLDGALVVDVPEPGAAEVAAMLQAQMPTLRKADVDRLLKIRERFAGLGEKESDRQKVQVGIRAMLQLATLLAAGMNETEAIAQAIVGKFLLNKDQYDSARLTNQLRVERSES